jgi:hypothetical protein
VSCCVNAHALFSVLLTRLANGGDVTEKELAAVIGAGCPRADVEAALARSDAAPFLRARDALARVAPSPA